MHYYIDIIYSVCVCMCLCVSGGKLPDMTPEIERQFTDEMERTKRIFGGGDMTEFPKFNFVDKTPSASGE